MNHITGIVDKVKSNFQFFPNPTIFSKGITMPTLKALPPLTGGLKQRVNDLSFDNNSLQTIEDDNFTYGSEFNSIHMSNFKSTPLPKTDHYVGFTAEGTFLT